MKIIKYVVFVPLVLSFTSCGDFWVSNYEFTTTAVYVAPKSKTKAYVLTKGFVPRDADLADDFESMKVNLLFGNSLSDSIVIRLQGENLYEVKIANQEATFSYFELVDHCKEYLNSRVDSSEASELVDALFSTTAGPKGTYMKGQAKSIMVDTVFFITKDR